MLLPQATELAEADALGHARLTPEVIRGIVALVPDEWLAHAAGTPAEERAAYAGFIENRLAQSATFVQEINDARHARI